MAPWLRALAFVVVCCLPRAGAAHVASPNVSASGAAGPYDLSVMIAPPPQAPGIATVEIGAADEHLTAVRLSALPIDSAAWSAAPARPLALRSARPGAVTFSDEVWVARPGSWRLEIQADGDRGAGLMSVVVPQPRRPGARLHVVLAVLRIA